MSNIAKNLSKFSKQECDALFKQGIVLLRSPFFTIIAIPRQGSFGRSVIVTSRRIGNAVTRNRLRRQIKAILYQEKLYSFGCDTAIITKQAATQLSFEDLTKTIINAYTTWQTKESHSSPAS